MQTTPEELFPRRRFSAVELDQMVEAGIIGEDERVELIDGELIEVSPQGPAHIRILSWLNGRLARAYVDGYVIQPQGPLDCGDENRPEPDLAVVRATEGQDADRLARGDELVLAIEISKTSQAHDHRKATVYARAGVPEYWILDLAARRLEVHRTPNPDGGYEVVTLLSERQSISPPGLDVTWRIADLLPQR